MVVWIQINRARKLLAIMAISETVSSVTCAAIDGRLVAGGWPPPQTAVPPADSITSATRLAFGTHPADRGTMNTRLPCGRHTDTSNAVER